MPALIRAAALLAALSSCAPPAYAARRPRAVCAPPVLFEGVGVVRICAPARAR